MRFTAILEPREQQQVEGPGMTDPETGEVYYVFDVTGVSTKLPVAREKAVGKAAGHIEDAVGTKIKGVLIGHFNPPPLYTDPANQRRKMEAADQVKLYRLTLPTR